MEHEASKTGFLNFEYLRRERKLSGPRLNGDFGKFHCRGPAGKFWAFPTFAPFTPATRIAKRRPQ